MSVRPRSLSPLRNLALNINDPQPRCWSYDFSDKDEEQCEKLPVAHRENSSAHDAKAKHTQEELIVIPAASSLAAPWVVDPDQAFSGGSLAPLAADTVLSDRQLQSRTSSKESVALKEVSKRMSEMGSNPESDEERDQLTRLVPTNHWKRRSVSFNSVGGGMYQSSPKNIESLRRSMSKLGPLVRSISNLSAIEVEASLNTSPRENFEFRNATGEFSSKDPSMASAQFLRSATKLSNATVHSARTAMSTISRSYESVMTRVTFGSQSDFAPSSSNSDNPKSTASTPGKHHLRLSSLTFSYNVRSSTQWRFLCPDNRSLVMLFPQGHEKLGIKRWVTVVVMNPALAAIVCLLLSNLFGMGLGQGFFIYEALVRGAAIRLPLLAISCSTTFLLHSTDWYKWDVHFFAKCAPALFVFYLWIATGACFTREWPFLPLAIAMLHLPLTIMFFRMSQFRMCYTVFFYNAVSISCFIVSIILLVLWLTWVFMTDRGWTPTTKDWLQSHMQGLHDAYGVQRWSDCKESDAKTECAKLELIAFLVWSCPLFFGITYLLMAGICHFRAWFLSKHEFKQFSIIITFTSTVIVFLIGAFWVCMSIAGADGEISMAILLIIGVCALSLCAWAYSSLVISDLVEYTSQMPIVMALKPMVNSDEFKGCVLCGAVGLVLPFLCLEILVCLFQRFLLCRSGPHPFLTPRALHLVHGVQGWHWGSVLEQAWAWSLFFVIVWIAGGQLATVFLVWLREKLFFMHFVSYAFVFVLVTLFLFLLPPIPGMLVYMSTSITIVAKAKQENGFGLGLGIVVACMSSLFLKMSAFAIEQTIFGRLLRKSMVVQRNWGPRNCWARAIEKIMKEPGLSIKKSLLVCGGPDWPCGVLLGILPIGKRQPLIHLLPVTVFIIAATISGAWMLDEDWKTGAQIIFRLITMLQGMLMTLACMLVLSVMHDQAEDLQATRSDVELVNKYIVRNERARRIYVLCTEWETLGVVCKILLVTGTGLEILSCWVFFFCSSACFRKFDLNSSFDAPLQQNGLGANVLNVFRPLGVFCLCMAVVGCVCMIGYYFITGQKAKQVLQGLKVQHRFERRSTKTLDRKGSKGNADQQIAGGSAKRPGRASSAGSRDLDEGNKSQDLTSHRTSHTSDKSEIATFSLKVKKSFAGLVRAAVLPSSGMRARSFVLERDDTQSIESPVSSIGMHRGTPSRVECGVLR